MTTDNQILTFIRSTAGAFVHSVIMPPNAKEVLVDLHEVMLALMTDVMNEEYHLGLMGSEEAKYILRAARRGWEYSLDPAKNGCPPELVEKVLVWTELEKPWAEAAFKFLEGRADGTT